MTRVSARTPIRLLEPAGEHHWVGLSYHVLSPNLCAPGEFDSALDAAVRTDAIGTAADDPRLRCIGTCVIAWIHATRGEGQLGVEWGRRAVALAGGPVAPALATREVGHGYLGSGDAARAIPALEQAVQYFDRNKQTRGLVLAFLAEALHRHGEHLRARETADTALSAARAVEFPLAIGWAQRALGRIEDRRNPVQRDALLGDALGTFERMGASFEAARTRLDLAEAAGECGDRDAAADHLAAAHRAFTTLATPIYVERTETLAAQLDVALRNGDGDAARGARGAH